jgi:hypothetical protein
MTSAIFFLLDFLRLTQRLRACGPAVIVASGHLSPRLAELTEFLLAATMLVTWLLRRRRRARGQHCPGAGKILKISEYVARAA